MTKINNPIIHKIVTAEIKCGPNRNWTKIEIFYINIEKTRQGIKINLCLLTSTTYPEFPKNIIDFCSEMDTNLKEFKKENQWETTSLFALAEAKAEITYKTATESKDLTEILEKYIKAGFPASTIL